MTPKDFEKKVEEAKEELSKKSYRDIQVETAYKWAARACASYKNILTADREQKLNIYILAQEYEHEAVEHAALAPTFPEDILNDIRELIAPFHTEAYNELDLVFGL